MFQLETFIGKLATAKDRHYTGAIVLNKEQTFVKQQTTITKDAYIDKVTALDHKVLDHSMECAALVADRHTILLILAGAELAEILACLRHNIGKQLDLHPAHLGAADGDVEEHHRIGRVAQLRLNLLPR